MEVKIERKDVLELTEEEAVWLRGLVQNPYPTQDNPEQDPDKEDPYDRKMRKRLWKVLLHSLGG